MMTRQELEDRTGIARSTLDQYVRWGIIKRTKKRGIQGGCFPAESLRRIRVMQLLKGRGMYMEDIGVLLEKRPSMTSAEAADIPIPKKKMLPGRKGKRKKDVSPPANGMLKIEDVAEQVGVGIQTIESYARNRLIDPPIAKELGHYGDFKHFRPHVVEQAKKVLKREEERVRWKREEEDNELRESIANEEPWEKVETTGMICQAELLRRTGLSKGTFLGLLRRGEIKEGTTRSGVRWRGEKVFYPKSIVEEIEQLIASSPSKGKAKTTLRSTESRFKDMPKSGRNEFKLELPDPIVDIAKRKCEEEGKSMSLLISELIDDKWKEEEEKRKSIDHWKEVPLIEAFKVVPQEGGEAAENALGIDVSGMVTREEVAKATGYSEKTIRNYGSLGIIKKGMRVANVGESHAKNYYPPETIQILLDKRNNAWGKATEEGSVVEADTGDMLSLAEVAERTGYTEATIRQYSVKRIICPATLVRDSDSKASEHYYPKDVVDSLLQRKFVRTQGEDVKLQATEANQERVEVDISGMVTVEEVSEKTGYAINTVKEYGRQGFIAKTIKRFDTKLSKPVHYLPHETIQILRDRRMGIKDRYKQAAEKYALSLDTTGMIELRELAKKLGYDEKTITGFVRQGILPNPKVVYPKGTNAKEQYFPEEVVAELEERQKKVKSQKSEHMKNVQTVSARVPGPHARARGGLRGFLKKLWHGE